MSTVSLDTLPEGEILEISKENLQASDPEDGVGEDLEPGSGIIGPR
jgi:hypothetical protein